MWAANPKKLIGANVLGPSKKGGDNGLNDLLVCVGGEQARERNPHCYRK